MASQNSEHRFEVSIHRNIIGKDPKAIRSEGWETKSRTAKELLNELTRDGCAVVPATLKSSRRTKDEFKGSSLVMLDFDSGQTIETVLSKSFVQKHGLFAYSTHSHVPGEVCQRFRVAIGLNTTITSRDHYEGVVGHLVQLLGSDTACTDACRLYYGNPGAEIDVAPGNRSTVNESPHPARLGRGLHHETNPPHSRADHPQAQDR